MAYTGGIYKELVTSMLQARKRGDQAETARLREQIKIYTGKKPGEVQYTVKEGDTLSSIASQYLDDPREAISIANASGLGRDSWSNIQPGQTLTIPLYRKYSKSAPYISPSLWASTLASEGKYEDLAKMLGVDPSDTTRFGQRFTEVTGLPVTTPLTGQAGVAHDYRRAVTPTTPLTGQAGLATYQTNAFQESVRDVLGSTQRGVRFDEETERGIAPTVQRLINSMLGITPPDFAANPELKHTWLGVGLPGPPDFAANPELKYTRPEYLYALAANAIDRAAPIGIVPPPKKGTARLLFESIADSLGIPIRRGLFAPDTPKVMRGNFADPRTLVTSEGAIINLEEPESYWKQLMNVPSWWRGVLTPVRGGWRRPQEMETAGSWHLFPTVRQWQKFGWLDMVPGMVLSTVDRPTMNLLGKTWGAIANTFVYVPTMIGAMFANYDAWGMAKAIEEAASQARESGGDNDVFSASFQAELFAQETKGTADEWLQHFTALGQALGEFKAYSRERLEVSRAFEHDVEAIELYYRQKHRNEARQNANLTRESEQKLKVGLQSYNLPPEEQLSILEEAVRLHYERTDITDYRFRITWIAENDGQDRLDKVNRAIAEFIYVNGRWPDPWEVGRISEFYINPWTEFGYEVFAGASSFIPTAPLFKAAKNGIGLVFKGFGGTVKLGADVLSEVPAIARASAALEEKPFIAFAQRFYGNLFRRASVNTMSIAATVTAEKVFGNIADHTNTYDEFVDALSRAMDDVDMADPNALRRFGLGPAERRMIAEKLAEIYPLDGDGAKKWYQIIDEAIEGVKDAELPRTLREMQDLIQDAHKTAVELMQTIAAGGDDMAEAVGKLTDLLAGGRLTVKATDILRMVIDADDAARAANEALALLDDATKKLGRSEEFAELAGRLADEAADSFARTPKNFFARLAGAFGEKVIKDHEVFIGNHLYQGLIAEFVRSLGKGKIKPTYGVKTVLAAMDGLRWIISKWARLALTARPGFTAINTMDTTLRLYIEGGGYGGSLAKIIDLGIVPPELAHRAGTFITEGKTLTQLLEEGWRPTGGLMSAFWNAAVPPGIRGKLPRMWWRKKGAMGTIEALYKGGARVSILDGFAAAGTVMEYGTGVRMFAKKFFDRLKPAERLMLANLGSSGDPVVDALLMGLRAQTGFDVGALAGLVNLASGADNAVLNPKIIDDIVRSMAESLLPREVAAAFLSDVSKRLSDELAKGTLTASRASNILDELVTEIDKTADETVMRLAELRDVAENADSRLVDELDLDALVGEAAQPVPHYKPHIPDSVADKIEARWGIDVHNLQTDEAIDLLERSLQKELEWKVLAAERVIPRTHLGAGEAYATVNGKFKAVRSALAEQASQAADEATRAELYAAAHYLSNIHDKVSLEGVVGRTLAWIVESPIGPVFKSGKHAMRAWVLYYAIDGASTKQLAKYFVTLIDLAEKNPAELARRFAAKEYPTYAEIFKILGWDIVMDEKTGKIFSITMPGMTRPRTERVLIDGFGEALGLATPYDFGKPIMYGETAVVKDAGLMWWQSLAERYRVKVNKPYLRNVVNKYLRGDYGTEPVLEEVAPEVVTPVAKAEVPVRVPAGVPVEVEELPKYWDGTGTPEIGQNVDILRKGEAEVIEVLAPAKNGAIRVRVRFPDGTISIHQGVAITPVEASEAVTPTITTPIETAVPQQAVQEVTAPPAPIYRPKQYASKDPYYFDEIPQDTLEQALEARRVFLGEPEPFQVAPSEMKRVIWDALRGKYRYANEWANNLAAMYPHRVASYDEFIRYLEEAIAELESKSGIYADAFRLDIEEAIRRAQGSAVRNHLYDALIDLGHSKDDIAKMTVDEVREALAESGRYFDPAQAATEKASVLRHQLTQVQGEFNDVQRAMGFDNGGPPPIPNFVIPQGTRTWLEGSQYAMRGAERLKEIIEVIRQNTENALNAGDDLFTPLTDAQRKLIATHGGRMVEAQEELYNALTYGTKGMDLNYLKGYKSNGALPEVNKALVDYSDTDSWEAAMKNVFPFWTFPTRTLPYWAEKFIQHPRLMTFYNKYVDMSRRYSIQAGLRTTYGEQLPSRRGYVPIGDTGIWINPLQPLSMRLAYPNADPYFEDEIANLSPSSRVLHVFLRYGPAMGFSINPLLSLLLYDVLGAAKQEIVPKWSFLPQFGLIHPSIWRGLREKAQDAPIVRGLINALNPEVDWKDMLIERRLLAKAAQYIEDHNLPELQARLYMQRAGQAATDWQARANDPDLQKMYDEARAEIEDEDWYRAIIGYLTGLYPKRNSDAEVVGFMLRDELNKQKWALNDQAQAEILNYYPDDPEARYYQGYLPYLESWKGWYARAYDMIQFVTYPEDWYGAVKPPEKIEGESEAAYNLRLANWTRATTGYGDIPVPGRPAYGFDRQKVLAYLWQKEMSNDAYWAKRMDAVETRDDALRLIPYGTPWNDQKKQIYDDYYAELNMIDAMDQYRLADKPWRRGNKPVEVVENYFIDRWWYQIKSTYPTYNKAEKTYDEWQAEIAAWEQDLPFIARALLQPYIDSSIKIYMQGNQVTNKQPMDFLALGRRLLEETSADGYYAWDKSRDSVGEAIENALMALYYNDYFDNVFTATGSARTLAEVQFLKEHPAFPTTAQITQWVIQNYQRQFTPEQIREGYEGRDVLSVEERLGHEEPKEIRDARNEIWDILLSVPKGTGYTDFVDRYRRMGYDDAHIETWYDTSGDGWDNKPERIYEFLDSLRAIKQDLGLRAPTEAELRARVADEKAQEEFKKWANDEITAQNVGGIPNLDAFYNFYDVYYNDFTDDERKQYRAQNKDQYALIPLYRDMRLAFAAFNPEWGRTHIQDYSPQETTELIAVASGAYPEGFTQAAGAMLIGEIESGEPISEAGKSLLVTLANNHYKWYDFINGILVREYMRELQEEGK